MVQAQRKEGKKGRKEERELKVQGCEIRVKADGAVLRCTRLWREMPASSKLAFGKRQRFRVVHRFLVELSYEQDRTGQFGSEGVKLGLAGGSRSRVSSAGREGAPCGAA